MRPAAEVHKRSVAIKRYLLARFRELLHEVDLHEVVASLEFFKTLLTRFAFANEFLVARDDLRHLRLNQLQIIWSERCRTIEIVKESSIGSRAVTKLRLRK